MAILQVPLISDFPKYRLRVELDEVSYILDIRLNVRMDRWIMDLSDVDGNLIKAGTPLLLGVPLLKQFSDTLPPAGTFFMFNPENLYIEAGKADLGSNVFMLYQEA